MYKTIMVPVDLSHADRLEKALATAADLTRLYSAKLHAVGVVSTAPGPVAHDPAEYTRKLEAFCTEQSDRHGVAFEAVSVTSHDPAVDLDDRLKSAAEELGADLVVMASHVPTFRDHFFSSNAGYLATHVNISVFIVR
ncbi:universal stress protein [uncultured Hoeflea sp.]|uniref:universal stress protein n=1 Tax=uncultured Hoeflea sp. TaxID=538666 RepID=UPI002601C196|nr:universal stress protein [uncultured Hoeflea sp.]